MEVIRHGDTYKEIECKKCGALLSYCAADIKIIDRYAGVFGGDWYTSCKKYITCPECEKEIVLSWKIDGEETAK